MINSADKQAGSDGAPRLLKADLKEALDNLGRLANEMEETPTPNLFQVEISQGQVVRPKKSLLRKGIDLTTRFLSQRRSQADEKKKSQTEEQILCWLDTIKNHFVRLEKLRQGDRDERLAANEVLKTIRKYNRLVKRANENPDSWTKRLSRFIYDSTGYSFGEGLKNSAVWLPLSSVKRRKYSYGNQLENEKVSALFMPATEPTHQELDAFRMKGATLIRKHSNQRLTADTLEMVRRSPVATVLASENSLAQVNLSQTLSPFPGETLKLQGSFRRMGEKGMPIPGAFQLLTESRQTGFPHPSQYAGWGLSEKLLPVYPLRLNDIPLVRSTLEKKWKIGRDLLPDGPSLPLAKRWLEALKTVYAESNKLIPLHRRLTNQLLGGADPIIENYFKELSLQGHPILSLARTWHVFNERYTDRLFNTLDLLSGRRVAEDIPALLTANLEKLNKKQAKRAAKGTTPWWRAEAAFIHLLGQRLGPAVVEILLQQASEKMQFQPQPLSNLAIRLQAAAWRQMLTFMRGLGQKDVLPADQMEEAVIRLIERDIELFSLDLEQLQDAEGMPLVATLDQYYLSRFQSSMQS